MLETSENAHRDALRKSGWQMPRDDRDNVGSARNEPRNERLGIGASSPFRLCVIRLVSVSRLHAEFQPIQRKQHQHLFERKAAGARGLER